MHDSINLTPAANEHITKWLAKRGSGLGLRLGVKTTGCSGLAYVVDITDHTDDSDQVFVQTNGLHIYIDAKSWPFVKGTQIDYVKEGLNSSLKFYNPNEKSSCGCGESFGV